MYAAIVFLPIIGSAIAGLFGRVIGARARELVTTGAAVRLGGAVGGGVQRCGAAGPSLHHPDPALDSFRRFRRGLDGAGRHHHRGDAGGGDRRFLAGASLFHRLHGRRPAPAALLLLSVAVHLRHADAGDGQQFPAAVLRLGRGGPGVLSADRLLVHAAQPPTPPRSRPLSSTGWAISALRWAFSASMPCSRPWISTRCSPPRPPWWARASSSPATASTSSPRSACCCSWARWASRRSWACTPGCRTRWKAPRRSPP